MLIKTRDIYNKAADILERDGWIRGCYFDNGSRCMVGAMHAAAAELSGHPQPLNLIEDGCLAQFLADRLGRSPTSWNDCVAYNARDVICKLHEVAILAGDAEVALLGPDVPHD